jgi:hypothetical protein
MIFIKIFFFSNRQVQHVRVITALLGDGGAPVKRVYSEFASLGNNFETFSFNG